MNLKLIAFSSVVFAVVGYAIYDYSTIDQKSDEKKERERIVSYKTEEVTRVTVAKADSPAIVIVQEGGRWKIESPINEEANQSESSNFVSDLLAERFITVVKESADADLQLYGLNEPTGKLIFESAAQKVSVLVGKKNLKGEPYVMVEGSNRILTGTNMWAIKIEQRLSEFRDRRIWQKSFDSVGEVTVRTGQGDIQLKKEPTKWVFSRSDLKKQEVDSARVQELITQLQGVEGIDILAENDQIDAKIKALGAQASQVEINFVDEQIKFLASKKGEKFAHLVIKKRLYKIAESDFMKFQNYSFSSFRNRRLPFQFSANETDKVKLSINGSPANTFTKNESNAWIWNESNQETEFKTDKLEGLVKTLSSLEAFDFHFGKLSIPQYEIEFNVAGKTQPVTFKIFSQITLNKQSEKFLVNPVVSSLSESIVVLKAEEVLNLGLSEILQKKALK